MSPETFADVVDRDWNANERADGNKSGSKGDADPVEMISQSYSHKTQTNRGTYEISDP